MNPSVILGSYAQYPAKPVLACYSLPVSVTWWHDAFSGSVVISLTYESRGRDLRIQSQYLVAAASLVACRTASVGQMLLTVVDSMYLDIEGRLSDGGPTNEQRLEDEDRRRETLELSQWCVV